MFNNIPSDRYAADKGFAADCFSSASIAESRCWLLCFVIDKTEI